MLQIHQQNESAYMVPFVADFDARPCVTLRTVPFLSSQSLTGHALLGQPSKKFKLTFQYERILEGGRHRSERPVRMDVTVQFRHCHEGFNLVPLTVVSILNFMYYYIFIF